VAHNFALYAVGSQLYAVGGRARTDTSRRRYGMAGARVYGPIADAALQSGLRGWGAQRALIRGDHPGCVEERPTFSPKCEYDGRFSAAQLGRRIFLYARANTASRGKTKKVFGGRHVQVASASEDDPARFGPFALLRFAGYAPQSSRNIYFAAVKPNPINASTLLALLPMQHGRKAYIGLALTTDGSNFSRIVPLVPSIRGSRGRSAAQPADGWIVRGEDVFFYVHHDVPGVLEKAGGRSRLESYSLSKAELEDYTRTALGELDAQRGTDSPEAAAAPDKAAGAAPDAAPEAAKRSDGRCAYPRVATDFGTCDFDLRKDTSYVPSRAWYEKQLVSADGGWRADALQLRRAWLGLRVGLSKRCPSKPFQLVALGNHGVVSAVKHLLAVAWRSWLAGRTVAVTDLREVDHGGDMLRRKWIWVDANAKCPKAGCASKLQKGLRTGTCPTRPCVGLVRGLDDEAELPATCLDGAGSAVAVPFEPHVLVHWDEQPHGAEKWAGWTPDLWTASDDAALPASEAPAAAVEPASDVGHLGRAFLARHGGLALMATVAAELIDLAPVLGHTAAPRCVAVHVRHGDSCGRASGYIKKFDARNRNVGQRRTCPPLSDYLAQVAKLARRYGFSAVYAATDDAQVAATIKNDAKHYGLEVELLAMDRSKYDAKRMIQHRNLSEFDHAQAAREVYYDVSALSQCDAFVGPMHSTMDSLVLELVTARLGFVPPFISMDDPWCGPENNFCPDNTPQTSVIAQRAKARRANALWG